MSNTPYTRRQARLRKQQERFDYLNYYARFGRGIAALDIFEQAEHRSLTLVMARARKAQQAHEKRIDVQLVMDEAA